MRILLTIVIAVLTSAAMAQTTPTLKTNLMIKLHEENALIQPIRATAQVYIDATSNKDKGILVGLSLEYSIRLMLRERDQIDELAWAWENSDKWPLPTSSGYQLTINAGARAQIIAEFNAQMRSVAIQRRDEWEALSQ